MNRHSIDMQEHSVSEFDAACDDAFSASEEQIVIALRAAGVSVEDVERLLSRNVFS